VKQLRFQTALQPVNSISIKTNVPSLAVWLSGNALVLVTLLLYTVGRVIHLGAQPATQVYSAWAIPLCAVTLSTQQKLAS